MRAMQNGDGGYATAGWAGGAQPILVVDRYAKSYGGRRAVDGVSLSVGAGSVFGFVGPNNNFFFSHIYSFRFSDTDSFRSYI